MGKWTGLDRHITAELANAEPEHVRLFGPSYDAKMGKYAARQSPGINRDSYRPWEKPTIERTKETKR